MRARELKPLTRSRLLSAVVSRPMRARELKLLRGKYLHGEPLSRPMRARELKHNQSERGAVFTCRAPCGRVN